MSMEKITKEELNGKQARIPLSDDELEQVTGGEGNKIVFGYAIISSLDGITTDDAPEGFILNGVKYARAYMTTRDAYGNVYEIYCGEGHMAIIPQG